ncbi:acyl-CoA thioesterase [Brevibacillus sp. B_LB10_24]|uniref:acyl-CoA thioesterase n=1 Tax=Brevibacillus sp. B_LB10_24 TaxID=3380645 RepID=UPI0038B779A2
MCHFIYNYKVKWGDTDAAGIVYYPNFYKWMDQAAHEMFNHLGFAVSKLFTEEKVGLPLLETHCEFKSPALFEDQLEVRTTVAEVRDKVIRLTHEFFRGGHLIANGYEVRAWTTFAEDNLKAVSIPEQVREALSNMKRVSC